MNTITKVSKKISVLILGLLVATAALAQDEDAGLSISGSVDTYYKYDFSESNQRGTWFAEDQNSVSIGMVDIALSHTIGKASFVGEVAFGPRADGYNATAPGPVQNLYVSYALTDALSVTGGFMGTFVGYEVISPSANFNYSASYLFSNGPFQNAGVKLDYAISDQFAVMFGVFSSIWDSYLADPDLGMNSIGAQVYVAPVDGWDVYINYINGSLFSEFDITTGYQISDAFYAGLNVAKNFEYGGVDDSGFFGAAAYLQYAVSDAAALGLRYENFAWDASGAESYNSVTISANLAAGPLTFIPELRFDTSDQDVFTDGDGAAAGSFTELLFAAVYSF
ncbi:MAG: outer membrane beta-barrel protein [Cyclobacteriaceae bacterium]